jgi:hypothetical protein
VKHPLADAHDMPGLPRETELSLERAGLYNSDTGELMDRQTPDGWGQGLTLVHFSARPEPVLTQNAPYTPRNAPLYPLKPPRTTPGYTPYPTESISVQLRSGRV